MPPGMPQLAAAAAGGLALAFGLVLILSGLYLVGAAIAVGGGALTGWSITRRP